MAGVRVRGGGQTAQSVRPHDDKDAHLSDPLSAGVVTAIARRRHLRTSPQRQADREGGPFAEPG